MAQFLAQSMLAIPDRTALITGGGSGLGRIIAKCFYANGASVTIVDRFQDRLDLVSSELRQIGRELGVSGTIQTILGDLGSEQGINQAVSQIKTKHKEIDILVMCAGTRRTNKSSFIPGDGLDSLVKATASLSYSDLDDSFRINVNAQYFLTAGLLDLIGAAAARGEGRGSIIMFSSVASKHVAQFVPAYQISKAAVDHLVRIMAAEFADLYIRVNAISPGIFPSTMNPADPTHPESNMKFAQFMPARRPGKEEEMAATALYLASAAGAYVTGQNLAVDGGRLLVAAGRIAPRL